MSRVESIEKLHQQLLQRRDSIRRLISQDFSGIGAEHPERTSDLLDAAAETMSDEVSTQLIDGEGRELTAIEDAIERIETGTYGVCDTCQKNIPLTRLRAIPHATDCIECRRRSERNAHSPILRLWSQSSEAGIEIS